MKKILAVLGALVAIVLLSGAGFVGVQVTRFNSSVAKVYDIAVPDLRASNDPEVLARGEHLARSLAGCATTDCHGGDLSGGKLLPMGPIGTLTGPNITSAGKLKDYSDGALVRLVRHGLKHDGRTLLFMPMHEMNWLPDDDLLAIAAWMRSMPPVEKPDGPMEIGLLGKVLDRLGAMKLDIARTIDHDNIPVAPDPAPTAAYGSFIARGCTGCHGENLSGGPLPGAPGNMAVPANLTPHETGLKGWSYADFDKAMRTGVRPDGRQLDPFMPYEGYARMDETEMTALWQYVRGVEARPFGGR